MVNTVEVELSMEASDEITAPAMAANIANEISFILDSVKNEIASDRAIRAYEIVKQKYEELRADINMMEDSLTELRNLGVHDYESQAEMFNQQLAKEIASNNYRAVKLLERKLDTLARYASGYIGLSQQLEYEREKLSLLKRKYEEAKVDAFEVLPQKFVVEKAFRAEKKAYPVRWLIVVITTLAAMLLASLMLVIVDSFEKARRFLKKPN